MKYLAALLLLLATPPSPKMLDGRSFSVMVGEKKLDTPHTLVFEKGRMRSPECSAWGFGAGTYTAERTERAEPSSDQIEFEATLRSDKEGAMRWTGKITKNKISGTSRWTKAGQAPIEYRFEGRF